MKSTYVVFLCQNFSIPVLEATSIYQPTNHIMTIRHKHFIWLAPSTLVNDGLNGDFGIDFDNSFMAGHSSGAHIAVNYLKQGCFDIKGLILLSPVDGVDPFGFIHDFCITPGEKLPFELPTLMLVAGLDSVPGL